MKTTEERRELVVTLCHDVSIPASVIVEYCDALLKGAKGPLTEEQHTDIGYIYKCSRFLLSVTDQIRQEIFEEAYPLTEQERFMHFLRYLLHDLRTPLSNILGFSQLNLKEVAGPINERQRESISHIHRLAQTLQSILDHHQGEAEKELRQQQKRPPGVRRW